MLSFKKLTLQDISAVKPYFSFASSRACDNSIGGTFMWRDFFETEYCIKNETLIIKVIYLKGQTAFSLPLGKDTPGCISEIEAYCRDLKIPLIFCTATKEDISVYKKIYPDIQMSPDQDWNDYLYNRDDLVFLSGRKYSGQRNHINHFIRTYPGYVFEEINQDNISELKDFYINITKGIDKNSRAFREEKNKTVEVLDNYEMYSLTGGLIRVDNKIVAFAIGEIINDTLHVHVERADHNYRGAYQMIVNLFPKFFAGEGIRYINREEDVGDEGLRTAKKAYHPVEIIEKFTVTVMEQCH